MRKTCFALTLAAAFAIAPCVSRAAEGHYFLSTEFGEMDYAASASPFGLNAFDNRKDFSFGMTLGYRWSPARPFWIGPEVGIMDLGKLYGSKSFAYGEGMRNDAYETKSSVFLAGMNSRWELGRHFYLAARSGLNVVHMASRIGRWYEGPDPDVRHSPYIHRIQYSGRSNRNAIGWYGSLGFGYNVSETFSVGLTYDIHHIRFDRFRKTHLTVGGIATEWKL
jgi:hypothetical protein